MFILFEDLWLALGSYKPEAVEAYFEERKKAEAMGLMKKVDEKILDGVAKPFVPDAARMSS